jgi:alanyl-tRNA synthetase
LIKEIEIIYSIPYPNIKTNGQEVLNAIFTHELKYVKTLEKGKRQIDNYLIKNKISKVNQKDLTYFKKQLGITLKLFHLLRQREVKYLIG